MCSHIFVVISEVQPSHTSSMRPLSYYNRLDLKSELVLGRENTTYNLN